MLTQEMKTLIANHSAGMVATTRDDGRPAVSPKATFVILDDQTLAFGNLRSPGTLANLRQRPAVEVCFIDVILRKAVRVTGSAKIIKKAEAEPALITAFEALWAPLPPPDVGLRGDHCGGRRTHPLPRLRPWPDGRGLEGHEPGEAERAIESPALAIAPTLSRWFRQFQTEEL